jgi:hypothetical protein
VLVVVAAAASDHEDLERLHVVRISGTNSRNSEGKEQDEKAAFHDDGSVRKLMEVQGSPQRGQEAEHAEKKVWLKLKKTLRTCVLCSSAPLR